MVKGLALPFKGRRRGNWFVFLTQSDFIQMLERSLELYDKTFIMYLNQAELSCRLLLKSHFEKYCRDSTKYQLGISFGREETWMSALPTHTSCKIGFLTQNMMAVSFCLHLLGWSIQADPTGDQIISCQDRAICRPVRTCNANVLRDSGAFRALYQKKHDYCRVF